MSDTIIKDPLTNTSAGVTDNGQLKGYSVTFSEMAYISERYADAFELHPHRFQGITSTEKFLVYFENIHSKKNFHIRSIKVWNNGGNSSYNRCFITRFYVGTETPSANAVTGKFGAGNLPHNVNLASQRNPDLDFRFWDNVGSGMTLPNTVKGEQLFCLLPSVGLSELKFEGFLIPPGKKCSISALAEDGDAASYNAIIVISGFFKDPM